MDRGRRPIISQACETLYGGPAAKSIDYVSERDSFFGNTGGLSNLRASASVPFPHD